jgi:hypothetical protein
MVESVKLGFVFRMGASISPNKVIVLHREFGLRLWFWPGVAPKGTPELETVLKGVFDRRRFLDLVKDFIAFVERLLGLFETRRRFTPVEMPVGY